MKVKKYGFAYVTQSVTRLYFTVQSTRQKGLVNGHSSTRFCRLCNAECFVCVDVLKSRSLIQFFSKVTCWLTRSTSWMTDQEDTINVSKKYLWRQQSNKKFKALLGTNKCQVSDNILFLLLVILSFCSSYLVDFGKFVFQELVTNEMFGCHFSVVQQDKFYTRHEYEKVRFYKKSGFYIFIRSFQVWKNGWLLTIDWKLVQSSTDFNFLSKLRTTLLWYEKRKWKKNKFV